MDSPNPVDAPSPAQSSLIASHFGWVILLVVGVLALCGSTLLGTRVLFTGDTFYYFYPLRYTLWQALQHFQLPFWESTVLSGNPFCANPQANCYYPPSLVFLLPDFFQAYHLSIAFHLMAGALGVFFWLKAGGRSGFSAFLTASVWVLCGTTLSMVNRLDKLQSLTWWPFALWGMEIWQRALLESLPKSSEPSGAPRPRSNPLRVFGDGQGLRHIAAGVFCCSAALALQLLAGGLELLPMTVGMLGMWVLVQTWEAPRPALLRVGSLSLLLLAGSLVLALWMTLPQWRELQELLQHSTRVSGLRLSRALELSLRPADLWELLIPWAFFDPVRWSYQPSPDAMTAPRYFYGLYFGGLPLILAGIGAVVGWRSRAERRTVYGCLILLALGLFFALGSYNPLYAWCFTHLPGLSIVRFPEKFLSLCGMALLPLLALGLDRFRYARGLVALIWLGISLLLVTALALPQVLQRVLALLLALSTDRSSIAAWGERLQSTLWPSLLVQLCLVWAGVSMLMVLSRFAPGTSTPPAPQTSASPHARHWHSRVAQLVVAAVALLELWSFNHTLNPTVDAEIFRNPPAIAQLVRGQHSNRVHLLPLYLGESLEDSRLPQTAEASYVHLQSLLYPNIGQLYGLAYGDGARAIRLEGQTQAFVRLIKLPILEQLEQLRQLGVPYVVSTSASSHEILEQYRQQQGGIQRRGEGEAGAVVWELEGVAPAAWLAPPAARGTSAAQSSDARSSEPLDETRFIRYDISMPTLRFHATSDWALEVLATDAGTAGRVVLPMSVYPGWEARVDDRLTSVETVNGYQLSVAVPQGWHEVRLHFTPTGQMGHWLLAAGGMVVWLALGGVAGGGIRRRQASTPVEKAE